MTDRWSALPPVAPPRGSIAVAAGGGRLHIFGDRVSTKVVKEPSKPGEPQFSAGFGTVGTHQVFDPATNRWSDAAPIPGEPRDHMGVAVLDGKIHLFGGRVADTIDNLARHDMFGPATGRWTRAAPLPTPRSSGAYTVLGGRIFYAGGECKPGGQPFTPNVFADVTAYDPRADTWATLPKLTRAARLGCRDGR